MRLGHLRTLPHCEPLNPNSRYVGDAVLKVAVRDIRKALKDPAQSPQFIETVHRRGYRFIAELQMQAIPQDTRQDTPQDTPQKVDQPPEAAQTPATQSPSPSLAPTLVGRAEALAGLHMHLQQAHQGNRQILFVTGEAGIGKSALLEAFLESVETGETGETVRVLQGQCVGHYGEGEAYLPILEAIGRWCRASHGQDALALLRRSAPTWLAQMPTLLAPAGRETLQHELLSATRERMLREMAETLEMLTAQTTLILVIEDLHWSDYSTLDLITSLAQRQEPARLLLIGTYRPVEVIVDQHPLKKVKQELQIRGLCHELALELLTSTDVDTYLTTQFPTHTWSEELAQALHRQTAGNPLFMVNVVEYAKDRELFIESDNAWAFQGGVDALTGAVPESLQDMVAQQIEQLQPEELRALEVASIIGLEFTTAAIAAALEEDVEHIEEWCEGLAQRGQFIQVLDVEDWPDGTLVARYRFTHTLYQEGLNQRLTGLRWVRFHQRIAERLEAAYTQHTDAIAAELAVHCEHGRKYAQAVQYLHQAATTALQRSANNEAASTLSKALELLDHLPSGPERAQQELSLHTMFGPVLIALQGNTATEVEHTYTRAQELCRELGETPQLFPALFGLRSFHLLRGEVPTAHEIGQQLMRIAQSMQDNDLMIEADVALASTSFFLGELTACQTHAEHGIDLYDEARHFSHVSQYGLDPGVFCLCRAGQILWLLGYPDQALEREREALTLAQRLAHPYSLGFALNNAAWVSYFRREATVTRDHADKAVDLSEENEFAFLAAWGTIIRGSALVMQGESASGMTHMRQGLATAPVTGAEATRPYLLTTLAEGHLSQGQVEPGLHALEEAWEGERKGGERFLAAERHRLKGELLLQQFQAWPEPSRRVHNAKPVLSGAEGSKVKSQKSVQEAKVSNPQAEAETCFRKALDIAGQQEAKSLELRAATSLGRLWAGQRKKKQARALVSEVYDWFSEGFDTPDLQDAKALLEAWG